MLGRRSSPIQMGFPTLCLVYSTAEEGNLELGNIFIQHFPARRHLSMKNLIQMEMRLRNRSFDRAFVKSNTIWISGNIAYFQYSANRMYTIYSSIQLSKQNSSNRNKIEDNWKSTFEEIRTSRNSKIFFSIVPRYPIVTVQRGSVSSNLPWQGRKPARYRPAAGILFFQPRYAANASGKIRPDFDPPPRSAWKPSFPPSLSLFLVNSRGCVTEKGG